MVLGYVKWFAPDTFFQLTQQYIGFQLSETSAVVQAIMAAGAELDGRYAAE